MMVLQQEQLVHAAGKEHTNERDHDNYDGF
jgi:hypothetical protein